MLVGCLAAPAAAEQLVLFDQGHGQRFLIDGSDPLGLSGLAAEVRGQGLTPRSLSGEISPATLQGAVALVVSGPFRPFGAGELATLDTFLGRGGRLCLLLHIAEPVRPLLQRLGVAATTAPLRETDHLSDGNPLAFRVANLVAHPLTGGVGGFQVNGCWGLANLSPASRVLAWSGPRAWSDLNGDGRRGAEEPFSTMGVMVGGGLGKGEFLVLGDDAVFQNQYLTEGNRQLAKNLAAWFKAGPAE